jgi:hypothetical protein
MRFEISHKFCDSKFRIKFARHLRFPPPWTVEDIGAAFVVTDSAGQKLACVYFEDEPGRLQHPGDEPKTLVGGGVTGPPF